MDILSGIGLGILVGSLLGFSVQSAIAAAIAGVLTLVTAFIGASRPLAFQPAPGDAQQNARVIAFGTAATLSFLVSYYVAVNRLLEPAPSTLKAKLIEAGFSEAEAKILVGARYFSVVPEGWKRSP